jgi:branched-chain amino acid transport system substrate-binding protein
MSRKLTLLLALFLLAGLMVSGAAAQDEGTAVIFDGDPVILGVATIRSGEGLVPLGDDILYGVELAIDARPTVTVDGVEFTVELDVQDDQCSDVGGQAVANYFISQPETVAIVGPTCSSACRAAGPILDRAGFTSISSSCTALDLTDEETGFASFNRTTANDGAQSEQAANFIYNVLGITKVAAIHDGSPYGEGLVTGLTATFTELGGEVVFADAITVGETNFRNILTSIAETDAEMIYFGGFPAEAARLLEQRLDVGLGELPFMGADGLFTPEVVTLAGDAAEGMYTSSPAPAESDALAAFIASYEEKYGIQPTAAFHSYAYDAANILLDGIEAVGTIDDEGSLVVDRAALAEFVRSYGADEAIVGLSGVLACDGTGECALGGIGFFQIENGQFLRLPDVVAETME